MAKKTLEACRTANDFINYVEKKEGQVKGYKNGVKMYGSKPGVAVLHSNHPRELATGTRHALIKALIAIGISGTFACMLLQGMAQSMLV